MKTFLDINQTLKLTINQYKYLEMENFPKTNGRILRLK